MSFPLGTDGWRGVIADGCTFASIERLAAATAEVYRSLPTGDTRAIVVGHDTRFFSPEFARRAADTLARGGVDVLLTDRPIPTPAVSEHVVHLGLAGGVAITASHNPGEYNGFKIKSHFGGSAPPELYGDVERAAGRAPAPSPRAGTVRVLDLLGPYRERLGQRVDLDSMRHAGLSVLADSMHGAAGSLVPDMLSGGKTRVVPFRSEGDPLFGGVHPEPIAANLGAASEKVRSERLDLAVAQDGDSDRLGVLDGRGRFVSPHKVLALLLLHAYRRRGLTGGIAKTFSTSLLIDRVAASLEVPLTETPIGFKYLADLMNRGEADAGGEESGGYAFSFHLPERDGVLNALLLIESLALSGRNLDGALEDLAAEFGEFAYGRLDVYLPVEMITAFLQMVRRQPPAEIVGEPVTGVSDLDGVKYSFGRRGWLLHRLSGTEPMVRLYCEHEDQGSVDRILEAARGRLERFARS
ncbi:MAG: phosphoglucomutase/phosphomannomutase family protein [Acidobacteriota bacterium]